MQYSFGVGTMIVAEADFKKGTSKLISCDVQLFADDDKTEAAWRGADGVVNKDGLKAQTQGLIQGLIANIHFAHQREYWDSVEHLRYIIENLEKGFAVSNVETTIGKF